MDNLWRQSRGAGCEPLGPRQGVGTRPIDAMESGADGRGRDTIARHDMNLVPASHEPIGPIDGITLQTAAGWIEMVEQ